MTTHNIEPGITISVTGRMVVLTVDGVTVNVTRTVIPTTLTPAERAALTSELAKRTEREWLASQRGEARMSVARQCAVVACDRASEVHKMCGAHYGRMNSRKVSYEEALNFTPIGVPDAPKVPPTAGRPSRLSDRFND